MKKSLIVLFVLSIGVLLNLAVPPFQNPDEPLHFATVLKYAHNGDDSEAQKDMIALLDKHSFWRLLGIGRPLVMPERLNEIKYVVGNYNVADYSELIKGLPVYYFLAGKMLRRLSGGDIVIAYFLLRLMSFLFFALAAYFLYLTFRRIEGAIVPPTSAIQASAPAALFGGSWLFLGFFCILFLPQLLLTSMAVNPDCLGLLIGAVFFYAAFSVLRGENGGRGRTALSIVASAAAILGVLVDNSLLPLILFAGVMFLFSFTRKNLQNTIVLLLFLSVAAILAVYFITLLFPLQMEKAYLYVRESIVFGLTSVKSIFTLSAFNRSFLRQLTDTFFLRFGWLVFGPARLIDWAWRGLVLAAMGGVGIYLCRAAALFIKRRWKDAELKKAEKPPRGDQEIAPGANSALAKLILFSVIVVGIQILGIRIFARADNLFSQGRYLFPVIAPVALLFNLGIKSLFDLAGKKSRDEPSRRKLTPRQSPGPRPPWKAGGLALRVLVLAMFIFLSFAILSYVIPVFHLSIKSPYSGL